MRLFVALDIPDDVRQSLAQIIQGLRVIAPQARWVRMEGVHITLKFIGETPDGNVAKIRDALFGVRARRPIELRFAGVGFFPNERRPRVLWAGIKADSSLSELASAIETVLEPLGIAREERKFSPHITLARLESFKASELFRKEVEKLGVPEFGHARASAFNIYQSVLKHGGAEYTRLVSYPFIDDSAGEPTP